MVKPDDLSKPPVAFDHDSTLMVVLEMSGRSWLAAAIVPGLDRRPLQKLLIDEHRLFQLLERWRGEARRRGKTITRVVLAHEAGRDGFWLARWLRARGVEVRVIHPTSIAVSREARRAKTDRLDTGMLMRALLGWLRAEPDCCRMVAIPSAEEEDLRRPGREREQLVGERTRVTNRIKSAMARLGMRGFRPGLAGAATQLSARMLFSRITLPHFSTSPARNERHRSGPAATTSAPCSSMRARTSAFARAPCSASSILLRMVGGVPARPRNAHQVGASKPAKPCCAKLFTPGTWRVSPAVVTPSGRSVPDLMCWLMMTTFDINSGTCADKASCRAGPPPR